MQRPSKSLLSMSARPVPEGGAATWRRVSHGSTRFSAHANLMQPQDGAVLSDVLRRVSLINGKLQQRLGQEPEDARLTGATRSLYRRLMGLNVMTPSQPTNPSVASVATIARREPRAIGPAPQRAQVA